ncbi:branched-chain amino acid ABC transporter permease [bacterium]|nr:branched-chain amino acid ABC transporter permease [bacterium]
MINPYWELIILLCLINIIFTISLNLILGYNGLFALGHAGFLAVGAYGSGVATASLGWPLWTGILLAILLSIVCAVLVGWPSLRLRGDYFAIATLGFAEIIRIVLLALPKDIFGGPTGMKNVLRFYEYFTVPVGMNGVGNLLFTALFSVAFLALLLWGTWAFANFAQRGISRFVAWDNWRWVVLGIVSLLCLAYGKRIGTFLLDIFQFGASFSKRSFESEQWALFLLFLLAVGLVTWLARNFLNSLPGRSVIAIREDEIAATNLGVNCTWMKLQNFMLGGALAGLAGAMLAHTLPLFKPLDFNFFKSVDVLLMVVLGGMGSISGSFVGAILITILPEALRFMAQWRLVIYSLILILFMIFRPGGLLGTSEIGELIRASVYKRETLGKGRGDA